MLKQSLMSPCMMLLIMGMVGCQTTNTYEPASPHAVVNTVLDKRVESDLSLKNKAQMQTLISARTPDGFLKIQARLYNGTNKRAKINYRFQWVDSQGMQIDTLLSTWKQLSIAGRETTLIQAIAPTKDATDFTLKLLEPRS